MKHIDNRRPQVKITTFVDNNKTTKDKVETTVKEENVVNTSKTEDKKKVNEVMTTSEKIAMAQSVLNNEAPKRIKKDKGLIERTESSKTILTEDNKELLKD